MSGNNENLRERLLSLEPVNPDFHERYKEEMEKMFTQEITGARRFGFISRDLFLLLFGLVLTASAIFNRPVALPITGRWLWGLSGVFTLGVALLGLRLSWKKNMDLRKDSTIISRYGATGLFVVAFALISTALLFGNLQGFAAITPTALLMIVLAILLGIDNRVQQSELNIREKLLEMQLQLSELQKERGSKS
ncbi:hypothetical protein LLH00_04025 [bacterium]|nr:hypothetical protein [bacterium]